MNKRMIWAVLGGVALSEVLRSGFARKAAVNGVAWGLKMKDEVEYRYNNIRDEAEDIYYEGKAQAEAEAEAYNYTIEEMIEEVDEEE